MLRKYLVKILFAFCFTYSFSFVNAQKSSFDTYNTHFKRAQELYAKEKYAAAQEYFIRASKEANESQLIEKEKADYYSLSCAVELFHDNSELLAEKFINSYPESPYLNAVTFKLASYEYGKKKYKQSLDFFAKVKKEELSDEENAEYYFKTGYSWFMIDSLDKARKAFYEIKDIDTRYTPAATYYYAHIAYQQKNYETAITGFNKLKDDETFAPLVPYYITQCYYFQEKYDQLLEYAPALIDSVVDTRQAEMAKMIGDAYYRKDMFKEAIPYYERFFNTGKDFNKEDYFQFGYCYYKLDDLNAAIPLLEKASSGNSAMSQNTNYLLGECYIRQKQKDKALLAFQAASNMDFSPSVKEDALFNYAVLTYELSNSPFNSSIKSLSEYIQKYPDSRRSDEAYKYLITACLNTHNYQEAINYLEKIKNREKPIKKAYQRATFFRGLELYNNTQFAESQKFFESSLKYADNDPLIGARAYYWLAETQYRNQNIDNAFENYQVFFASPEAPKCPEYSNINYNLAYCHFQQHQYDAAAQDFKTFISNQKNKKSKLIADAYNRLGDCSFTGANYKEAIDNYDKSIELGLSDKDYALYQKAFSLGLLGDHRKKVTILENLQKEFPESAYSDDAIYESGRAYVALQQNNDATASFNKLLNNYPSSSYVRKALLQLGLIDYNAGKNQEAIDKYKRVVAEYPGTNESRSALLGIKNIYVEMNDVDKYLAYAETLGSIGNVSLAEKDSLLYNSAEGQFMAGDCKKAQASFGKYLDTYPKGNFVTNAFFYKAECYRQNNELALALDAYNKVISKPTNDFTEPSLVAASGINMNNKDYNTALDNYTYLDSVAEIEDNKILARTGIMLARYNLSQYSDAVEASQRLLKTAGISQETERKARYVQAKSLLAIGDNTQALEILKKLATDVKNNEGAESKYLVSKIYFDQKQSQKAEKEIFSFIDMNSPHQYWVAKAFILLAEIYYNKKDVFQATNTLQSIISNYTIKDDSIIDEATALKQKIEGKSTNANKQNKSEAQSGEEGL